MTKYEGYKKSCKAFVFTAFWSCVSYEKVTRDIIYFLCMHLLSLQLFYDYLFSLKNSHTILIM